VGNRIPDCGVAGTLKTGAGGINRGYTVFKDGLIITTLSPEKLTKQNRIAGLSMAIYAAAPIKL
jgi:hypothetical protein